MAIPLTLNRERGARQHMQKLLNEALDTRIANNLSEYWLQMNGTGFLVLDACSYKNFQMEKFLRDLVFSSISSLCISVPYKVVPYTKNVKSLLPELIFAH